MDCASDAESAEPFPSLLSFRCLRIRFLKLKPLLEC